MDIEDLRIMIRQSIRAQAKKLVEERLKPPASFEKFNFLVKEALEDVERPDEIPSHEAVYRMWENISAEIEELKDAREIVSEWNSALVYYVDLLDAPQTTRALLFKRLRR